MATRAADASRDASRDDGSAETTVILRVAETATRFKHRVSLVATLPVVRRLRNFLNPHSRLPNCDKDMVLLGERYERMRTGNEAKGAGEDEDGEDESAPSSSAVDAADPGLAAFLCDLRSRVWITYRRLPRHRERCRQRKRRKRRKRGRFRFRSVRFRSVRFRSVLRLRDSAAYC